MVFNPLGARQSAVCRSAGEKDCCNRVPVSRAFQTLCARCYEFMLADGSRRAAAIALLVLPLIVGSRCCSGPAIR
jgi:hypothetical protein